MSAYDDVDSGLEKVFSSAYVSGGKQSYKGKNPTEYAKVKAYLEGGAEPTAATLMGQGLIEIERGRRALAAPPPPPPPPPPANGDLQFFTDFHAVNQNCYGHANGDILVRAFQPRLGCGNPTYAYAPANATAPPWTAWANGGGLFEVSTPYGPGFKAVVTDAMTQPSGGKNAFILDDDWLIDRQNFLGLEQIWTGKFMLPAAGNPSFSRQFITLWEWHVQSASGNIIQIDWGTMRPRFGIYNGSYTFYPAADPLVLDHWYDWRIEIRWQSNSTGYFRGWIDGTQLVNYAGSTIPAGETPYLQFGFYSGADAPRNECHWANLNVTNPSRPPH